MWDLFFLAVMIGFFLVAMALIRGCERLEQEDE
jgi:hypothetical protein